MNLLMKLNSAPRERRARGVLTSTRPLTQEQRLRIWRGKSLRINKRIQEDKHDRSIPQKSS